MINNFFEFLGYIAMLITGCFFAACFLPILIGVGMIFSRPIKKVKPNYPSATSKNKTI